MINSIKKRSFLQKIVRKKFYLLAFSILAFWYISLFPGRAGADAVGLVRLIKSGGTTNWWTSSYFWFIKFSTFDGRSIALTSFLLLITQAMTFFWCIKALPGDIKLKENAFLILLATPLFSVFGLNIGHDTLQVSGLFILIGIELRRIQKIQANRKRILFEYTLSFLLLTTTQTGVYIVILSLLILCIRRQFKYAFILTMFITIFILISNLGVSTTLFNGVEVTHTADAKFAPMLADLKCVAQHPLADIGEQQWLVLEKIASKDVWKTQLSCDSTDSISGLKMRPKSLNLNSINFFKTYMSVTFNNPAIVAMAHIQRGRGLLPPPFFQAPDNQVTLDTKIPVGFGTNTALQSGPELLHPSIDEPTLKVNSPVLKILESLAQGPIFIFNQASWFWGWAGLWTWPILIYWAWKLKIRKLKTIIVTLYPIIALHSLLLFVIPLSHPRYYMAAIILGVYLTILMLLETLSSNKSSNDIKPLSLDKG